MGATQSGVISHDEFKNYLYGTVLLMLAPQLDPQFRFEECSNIKEEDTHVLPLVSSDHNLTVEEMLIAYTQYYGSNNGKEEAIDKYVKDHILDSREHIMLFIKNLVAQLQDRKHRQSERRHQTQQSLHQHQPQQSLHQAQQQSLQQTQHQPQQHQPQLHQPQQSLHQAQPQQSLHQAQPQQSLHQAQLHQPQQPQQTQQALETHQVSEDQVPQRIRGHNKLQRRLVALGHALDNEQAAYQQQMQQLNQSYLPVTHNAQDIEEIYAEETTQEGDYEGHTYSGEDPE